MTEARIRQLFPNASSEFIRANLLTGEDDRYVLPASMVREAAKTPSTGIVAQKKPIHEVHTRSKTPRSIPQQTAGHESMATKAGKGSPPRRLLVRITSVRRRLLDSDNLIGKYYVDCLRYCGILLNDTEAEIDFRISQKKARTKDEERTIIEVEYCSPI